MFNEGCCAPPRNNGLNQDSWFRNGESISDFRADLSLGNNRDFGATLGVIAAFLFTPASMNCSRVLNKSSSFVFTSIKRVNK